MFIVFEAQAQTVVKLWEEVVPANKVNEDQAEMIIYHPEKSKSKNIAVIICPGGGYGGLAINHEGYQFAEWFISEGYTAIVLRYRLPNGNKYIPLEDVQQAFRYVRSKSKEWNIEKIGVAGFSAGGHLASTASTHFKDSDTRPDFSILFYPVITMQDYTHNGSKKNLLGDNPSLSDIHIYSNEKQVNSSTPPAILLLSDDDRGVLPKNSIRYYEALKDNNISATMYIFPEGGHGWGMKENFKYHKEMLSLLKSWLNDLK